ncbi:RNA-binding protein RO60-like [Saccostrea echinata]|uniref:RNA-binding protein RO60-like n=1 Tax=Saccostrea echinata TaxID=191078 RepID=UPI002A83019F|nr:RNA-binding protein RO60-like [Saccostrea echinata]
MANSVEEESLEKLKQWLILYRDDGAYKVISKTFSREKALCVTQLLADGHGKEVLSQIQRYSSSAALIDREPLLFAYALCCKSTDKNTKKQAEQLCDKICKTPCDLFQLFKFHNNLSTTKSWGRYFKRLISTWYHNQDPYQLARNVSKEISFLGWSHRDALRMGHLKPKTDEMDLIFKYLVLGLAETKKSFGKSDKESIQKLLEFLSAVDIAKHKEDVLQVAKLVEFHSLKKDHLRTVLLKEKEIWTALLKEMTIQEILENIGQLANIGYLDEGFDGSQSVVDKLMNEALLKEQNVQPFEVIIASNYYKEGRKKGITWQHNDKVIRALDFALDYTSKGNLKPTGKRCVVAIRIGINRNKSTVRGTMTLSTTAAAAGVAMVITRGEENADVVFFTDTVTPLTVTKETKLTDMQNDIKEQVKKANKKEEDDQEPEVGDDGEEADIFVGVPPEPCDLVAPIQWATSQKKDVDVFILVTDANKSTGSKNLGEAIAQYRKDRNLPNTKLVTIGLTNSNMKFANLEDQNMLDVSGFDAKVPKVIQTFLSEAY